jgi:deoxyribodipyrimidine photolyase
MDTVDDVIRIQESAEMLQKVIKSKLGDGLQEMTAVQERLETYNIHGNRFSERIFKFLKEQFEYQVERNDCSQKKQSSLTCYLRVGKGLL